MPSHDPAPVSKTTSVKEIENAIFRKLRASRRSPLESVCVDPSRVSGGLQGPGMTEDVDEAPVSPGLARQMDEDLDAAAEWAPTAATRRATPPNTTTAGDLLRKLRSSALPAAPAPATKPYVPVQNPTESLAARILQNIKNR